jgi:hypothetical protein
VFAIIAVAVAVAVAASVFALSRADIHGGDTSLVHACVNTTNGDVRTIAAPGAEGPRSL